jgi:hypothetical protein
LARFSQVDVEDRVREFKISHRIAIDSCCLEERISGIRIFLPPRRTELVPNQGLARKKAIMKISIFVNF